MLKNAEIFGLKIAAGRRGELYERCASLIGSGGAISTVNPEILYNATKDNELYEALSDSLCIPDGVGVERALRRMGIENERFPGVELGEALLEVKPVRLAIIGGKRGVAERAMNNLLARHPLASRAFAHDGYSYSAEKIISLLREHRPDIVFVCLGSPKQEIFIKRIKVCAPWALFVALGGSVNVYSGDIARAPRMFRKMGCEWVFRLLREPGRIKRLPRLFAFMHYSSKERGKMRKSAEKQAKKT